MATFVDFYSGTDNAVIADHDAIAYISLRINLDILTKLHPIADVSKGSDITFLGNLDTLCDEARLLHSLRLRLHALYETEQFGKCGIGIVNPDERGRIVSLRREISADYHGGSLRFIYEMGIFGIGDKRHISLFRLFNLGKSGKPDVRISIYRAFGRSRKITG